MPISQTGEATQADAITQAVDSAFRDLGSGLQSRIENLSAATDSHDEASVVDRVLSFWVGQPEVASLVVDYLKTSSRDSLSKAFELYHNSLKLRAKALAPGSVYAAPAILQVGRACNQLGRLFVLPEVASQVAVKVLSCIKTEEDPFLAEEVGVSLLSLELEDPCWQELLGRARDRDGIENRNALRVVFRRPDGQGYLEAVEVRMLEERQIDLLLLIRAYENPSASRSELDRGRGYNYHFTPAAIRAAILGTNDSPEIHEALCNTYHFESSVQTPTILRELLNLDHDQREDLRINGRPEGADDSIDRNLHLTNPALFELHLLRQEAIKLVNENSTRPIANTMPPISLTALLSAESMEKLTKEDYADLFGGLHLQAATRLLHWSAELIEDRVANSREIFEHLLSSDHLSGQAEEVLGDLLS